MSQLKNRSSQCLWTSTICILLLSMSSMTLGAVSRHYGEALTKSLLYFEAQRSGKLPSNQRVNWRGDSALRDGSDAHVDLTGGYYDAGDNMKFGFPLAFTTTMLAWSSVEMTSQLKAHKEHKNVLAALKWATDYLIKAHPEPNVLYGQVGDGNSDHACWMRPEDMTTPRPSYRIDAQHPGADLAGETAAAMAAASLAFAPYNAAYAKKLISHAKDLFEFAKAHPGVYQSSISNAGGFYASSGYEDELLWAAAWLHRATKKQIYLNDLNEASNTGGSRTVFAWDDKFVGAQVLMAKVDYMLGSNPKNMSYMVGFGTNYPKRPHHRGASIVSIKKNRIAVECNAGFNDWYHSPAPNPNVLTGALVGGPDENDAYEDERTDFQHSEPVSATVAPFVGVLAAIA
ncbi:hypothetical protein F2Q70_00024610 [Brassica cretica]|uniref:Endoglucanase n=1 Tax=Brassica cretica TaxID=69181 RepID=A0A8S9LE35_BRACR|nr:hypothetical protein F2Q68_00023930 [Brassica cretica]KAF2604532.1 hypothetical protein F2Q70_00024610 [Brassica cretica]